jgi:hypothetical protein
MWATGGSLGEQIDICGAILLLRAEQRCCLHACINDRHEFLEFELRPDGRVSRCKVFDAKPLDHLTQSLPLD